MRNGKTLLRLAIILPVTWLCLLLIGSVTYSGGVEIASAQETIPQTEENDLEGVTEAFYLLKYDLAVEQAAHLADSRADSLMFHYMQQSYLDQMETDRHQRRREMAMVLIGVVLGGVLIYAGAAVTD